MKKLTALLAALLLPLAVFAVGIVNFNARLYVDPPAPPSISAGSLVFTGVIDESTDRLNIQAEGTTVDVGAGEFTIELWLRPDATGNGAGSGTCATGSGYRFPETDIFMDRDNLCSVRDFGAGLSAGRVCFSIENAAGSFSVVGSTDITNDQWHHVAMQYRASDGLIELYVDGDREASSDGPNGTISLPACASGHEELLVFGTEKHGFDVSGYEGAMSSIHIWEELRYSGLTYTVPTAPIAGALHRYLMDENTGTQVGDSAGSVDGMIAAGGVPAWSTDNPF